MNSGKYIQLLENNSNHFHRVVPFDPAHENLLPVNLAATNKKLPAEISGDRVELGNYIRQLMKNAGAVYGIGGYGEHRSIYAGSRVFDAELPGENPRRLHLGTDIWGIAGTAVMAPADAILHSLAFNDKPGDYGATIILAHTIQGHTYHTLYGHLELESLANKKPGQKIEKGELFARFGKPGENGQWSPHLHFQLINDIGSWKGDYPGVCAENEKDKWLANSPDPDLILQMNRYLDNSFRISEV